MKRLITFLFVVCAVSTANAQQRAKFTTIEDAVMAPLSGRSGPRSVNWIDNGDRFAYTIANPQTRAEEIRRFDPATLNDELLLNTGELLLPGTQQRLTYNSFQWSKDSQHLLFQTNFRPIFRRSGLADFFLYSVTDKAMQLVAKDARTAELSPNGTMTGYERRGDMYVYDIANKAERRLTSSGTDTLFNGNFDWVYEEEFGMAQAWRWSPDSRHIAFWQTNEAKVPAVQITNWEGHWPEFENINYPKVGDANPRVRIGVVDVQSGKTVWFQMQDTTEEYVPRIYWTSDPNVLAILTLNRAQNDARVYFFDVQTGTIRKVMEETSKYYVDVYDFFGNVQDFLTFPEGTREFFWLSDRDGYQHVYRYDYTGKLLNQV